MTAFLSALIVVKATVTLLALLHDLVAAKGTVTLSEAVGLPAVSDGIQDGRDVGLGAVGKLVIVVSISRGGRGKHDVVATHSARSTLGREVVLKVKKRSHSLLTLDHDQRLTGDPKL